MIGDEREPPVDNRDMGVKDTERPDAIGKGNDLGFREFSKFYIAAQPHERLSK